jgi:hypothetical protein
VTLRTIIRSKPRTVRVLSSAKCWHYKPPLLASSLRSRIMSSQVHSPHTTHRAGSPTTSHS